MNKGRRDQHASAKMSREEEELMGHRYLRKAFDDDGEGAC
jgi:hypothetical protein